ncbi:MAG: V-type proton ATPase subunit E [Faecalibacterium sp.]|nr:V-type proton ATPase subunit E [Ruminococcus sp.]MCM1392629.1 V-type proton ATPase subunit E [Ruminococcus sp.]MCM1486064.1 V-type proton ATPase subunit E [Faecalibacterium sp.]
MLNQNDKIERFAEVINQNAQDKCKKINKRADKFKKEQFKKLEDQAKEELNSRLNFELDRLSAETNGEISRLQNEIKLKVVARRDEITAEVFKKAAEKIAAFTETDEYKVFLESSIKTLIDKIGEEVILFAKEADADAVKAIALSYSAVKQVRPLKKIKIGGVAAASIDETVFVDDTLDERLASQKEWFMASSGLTVNE